MKFVLLPFSLKSAPRPLSLVFFWYLLFIFEHENVFYIFDRRS